MRRSRSSTKRRPKPNVAEAMNLIGEVDGKTAIIVDDIVDTAGTLVSGIQMLRDKGAKAIYASCVHGVLSGPAIDRLKAADLAGFICTNTIDQTEKEKLYDKMTVLSVGPILAASSAPWKKTVRSARSSPFSLNKDT